MRLTIVLFLLCTSLLQAQTIADYFNKFPFKPLDITVDSAREHLRIEVDQKNAFVDVHYDDADYGYEYGGNFQFTYFAKKDKSKLFGISQFFEGPSSNSTDTDFYDFRNNEWIRVTEDVLPKLSLYDFDPGTTVADSIGSNYLLRIELPQQGTDLQLSIMGVGENDISGSFENYYRFIESFPKLALTWNREKGIFEKKRLTSGFKK
jgi:hypothetical protein